MLYTREIMMDINKNMYFFKDIFLLSLQNIVLVFKMM